MDIVPCILGLQTKFGYFTSTRLISNDKSLSSENLIAKYSPKVSQINLTLVLDNSGSMLENMESVVRTALAAVELLVDGSHLRVLIFDHEACELLARTKIDHLNKTSIKSLLKDLIVNHSGATNLQDAIIKTLTNTDQNILFLTDGIANRGHATSSDALIRLARIMPTYNTNVFHCLGLQLDPEQLLNGYLLKSLAVDSGGSYETVRDPEQIPSFLGDIFAHYMMTLYKNVCVEIESGTIKPECLSPMPNRGLTLRADSNNTLVHLWTSRPSTVFIKFLGRNVSCDIQNADIQAEYDIYRQLAAYFIELRHFSNFEDLKLIVQNKIDTGHAQFAQILTILENFSDDQNEANDSRLMFDLTCRDSDPSNITQTMRNRSYEASQIPT